MTDDLHDDLSPAELRAFGALPREATPPAHLEDRTVAALRARGVLPTPIGARVRPSAGRWPSWMPAAAAAAAIALFLSGMAVGQMVGAQAALRVAQASASAASASEAAAHIEHTGRLYVEALSSLNRFSDTLNVQARDNARAAAVRVLAAAAEEIAHVAPDDPLAAAVLRGINQEHRTAGRDVPSRSVIWY